MFAYMRRAVSHVHTAVVVCAMAAIILCCGTPASAQYNTRAWGDDFPGAAGSAPNPANWGYALGNQWGNGELDFGTNSRQNSYIDGNGNLVIAAVDGGANANPRYTSGHLQTEGLINVGPYGQVEASIQTPAGTGIGEAFWALGTNFPTVGWPTCGEIDIMESHGTQASQSNGTIHANGYADFGISAAYVNGSPLTNSFNTYGIYWMPFHIQFYFNGNTYSDQDVTKMASNVGWPFNQAIYVIDSVGVGGQVAGPPPTGLMSPNPANQLTHYVHWNTWTPGVPGAPSNLTGSANSNSITLNWNASSTAGVTYNVYMNSSNNFAAGDLNTLEEYAVSGTTFTAGGLQPSTTYYFQVRAQNQGGESAATNTFSMATQGRGNAGPVRINCGGFGIGNFMPDAGVAQLRAFGNPASNPFPPTYNVGGLTNPAPNNVYDSYDWAPTSFPINDLNANALYTVRLHFCENQFNAVGGRIFNVFVNGNPVLQNFDVFATAGAIDKALIYQYTAMSDGNGNVQIDTTLGSANDPEISAIEVIPNAGANNLPGAPGGLTASGISTNQISLSWNAVGGATSYNIFRSISPNFTPSGSTYAESVTGTTATDNVLYTGTTYYYRVAAVNSTGEGPASAQVSAATQTSATVIGAVNCGGPANGAFAADQDFSNGTTNNFGSTTIDTSALSGSTIPSQTVFETDREGTFGYTFSNLQFGRPVTVTLYFMENYFTAAGSRIFSVTANNNTVLTNYDIFAAAGAKDKAVQVSFNTYVNNQGQINLNFTPSKDNAECSAILLNVGPNPPVPTAPAASAADLATTANMISWPTTDPSITKWTIYRSTTSGQETLLKDNLTSGNYEDSGLTNGTRYYYKVTATNWSGTSGSNETSAVPNPWALPGTVYAANFNVGGEGVGYHSTATSNYGGFYRTNENVAIEQCLDTTGTAVPYDVSFESTGQWMKYTVNVAQAGSYTVNFQMASFGGALFHLEDQNGNNLTGELVPPTTNGFQVWAAVSATINLTAGVQTLKYVEDGNTYNFHYMTFTFNGGTQPPPAPTGLTATAGSSQVALAWTASSGATSYNVYRGTTSNGESTTPIASGFSATSYSDTAVTNGTTYYYKVAAVNSGGTSGMSNEASATPQAAPALSINSGGAAASPFVADTDFTGGSTAAVTNTIDTTLLTAPVPPQAVLQSNRYGAFTYTIPGLTAGNSYPVTLYFAEEYWTAAGKRTFNIAINGTTVLTNFDIFATAGAAFKGVQKTFTATANSSGQIVITTTNVIDNAQINGVVIGGSSGGGTAPPTPTGVSASAGNTQVTVSWGASTGATSYNLYRSTTSGGEGTTAYKTGIAASPFTDTGVTNGTTYFYKVAAVNSVGSSAQSSEVSATPQPTIPAAPTGLTAAGGNAQITLTWTSSTGATSYNLLRSLTTGTEAAYKTGVSSGFVDTGLTNGTTYFYKVTAVNSAGTSPASNEASATPSGGTGPSVLINCGGTATGSWVADTDFSGGGTNSWANAVDTSLLTGTIPPQAVLQTDREGMASYTIGGFTANSSHTITMYFVEQYWNAAGKRVFSVTSNGTAEITNLDVFATAGADFKAVQKSFTATANASGQYVLAFTASADQAKVGGITVQ